MNKLIERVWETHKNNPYGFTLNLETLEYVKFGISVAYKETQNCFTKESLKIVIDHALKHNKIVGGRLSDNGNYYFDSCRVFKNSELEKAIEFAKQNKQLTIYDITNLEEIKIEQ